MLEAEDAIQDALNQAGAMATTEALKRSDTNGRPITVADTKLSSKGRLPKDYQTPYSVATVSRNVYLSSHGGKTFCPPHEAARIVISSSRRFTKMADAGRLLSPGARIVVRIVVQSSASTITSYQFTLHDGGAMLDCEMSPDQLGDGRPYNRSPVRGLYLVGQWTRPWSGITPVIVSALRVARLILEGSSQSTPVGAWERRSRSRWRPWCSIGGGRIS